MIRTILVETALFLTPFVIYGIVLYSLRGSIVPEHWSPRALAICAVCAVVLMAGGLFLFEWDRGSPPGSVYVPAHMENGVFVPGQYK